MRKFIILTALCSWVRPVPNVVLLPCQTQMKVSFWFKHGSSSPFETIKRGTSELGSAWLLSTASLAVPHGSSTICFQHRAIVVRNSIHKLIQCIFHYWHMIPLDGWFVLSFEFSSTVLGSRFETATVLLSCHCRTKFVWVRHGSSTTFGTGLKASAQSC